jgi:phosphate transport system substrate-binding protein
MNTNKKGITTTSVALVIALAFALTAMVPAIEGSTTTITSTLTYPPLTIQAGGATFPNPVMQVWATTFADYTNGAVKTNYQAIGSGAGITGILKKTFMYAGSDAPVPTSQSANYSAVYGPLLQIPETLGGVAIFYNIPGVSISLNLTGPVIARIYLGNITTWNDPAIAALNPGCKPGSHTCVLPGNTIQPVHRSDGSGTTYAFTDYLEKVSTDWNASFSGGCPCHATSISWPSFEVAAKGSGGVAAYVLGNPNTVGYADSYYAFSNSLQAAAVRNSKGNFLVPTLANIAAAATDFSAQVQANPTFTITNAPGANSYPISTYTYLLVWQDQTDQNQGFDVVQLLQWIVNQGQAFGPGLNYPSLPANIVPIDQALVAKIDYHGIPYISTSITVSCNHVSGFVASAAACKAKVVGSGSVPTGSLTWSSYDSGTFSKLTCKLSKGTCSASFKPTAAGPSVQVTANYGGDSKNSASAGTYILTVAKKNTATTISCTPKSAVAGSSTTITCKAKVTGFLPTGTVSWSQSGTGSVSISSASCTLTQGTSPSQGICSVTMTGSTSGAVTLEGTYNGDSNNRGSSRTAALTIH